MELFYRHFGNGKPIIILHGLFGSSDNWLTIGKQLSNDHLVYIPDQRNHGQSFHSAEFNYQLMADDLYHFIKQHGIIDPVVIGHSMGGKVAMNLAVKHKEIISILVVIDIAPKHYPVHHDEILKGLEAINPEEVNSRAEADTILAEYVPANGTRNFLLKNLSRDPNGGYRWKLNLSVISENIEKVGEGLSPYEPYLGPTLFITGGESHYISNMDLPLIKEVFPNSKVTSIPDAGHWVHAEKPTELVATLRAFIND